MEAPLLRIYVIPAGTDLGGAGAGCGFAVADAADAAPLSLSFPLTSASIVVFLSFFFFLTSLKWVLVTNVGHQEFVQTLSHV